MIGRRWGFRNSGGIYRLGTLSVRYREGSTASSTAPLGTADDEEERHQTAEWADVPNYRPWIQRTLQIAVDYNKTGTCERATLVNNQKRVSYFKLYTHAKRLIEV